MVKKFHHAMSGLTRRKAMVSRWPLTALRMRHGRGRCAAFVRAVGFDRSKAARLAHKFHVEAPPTFSMVRAGRQVPARRCCLRAMMLPWNPGSPAGCGSVAILIRSGRRKIIGARSAQENGRIAPGGISAMGRKRLQSRREPGIALAKDQPRLIVDLLKRERMRDQRVHSSAPCTHVEIHTREKQGGPWFEQRGDVVKQAPCLGTLKIAHHILRKDDVCRGNLLPHVGVGGVGTVKSNMPRDLRLYGPLIAILLKRIRDETASDQWIVEYQIRRIFGGARNRQDIRVDIVGVDRECDIRPALDQYRGDGVGFRAARTAYDDNADGLPGFASLDEVHDGSAEGVELCRQAQKMRKRKTLAILQMQSQSMAQCLPAGRLGKSLHTRNHFQPASTCDTAHINALPFLLAKDRFGTLPVRPPGARAAARPSHASSLLSNQRFW
ncbi:MAG: hypothetical protein WBW61_07955 [Rhodanobacteraceae bacterium]